MVNIRHLIDDVKCFETVRDLRWPQGVTCPHCGAARITKQGTTQRNPHASATGAKPVRNSSTTSPGRSLPAITSPCGSGTSYYFMGLNLSNEQIGKELDLDPDDAQTMTTKLREGIVQHKPVEALQGEVECDEAYVVAGHKGYPEAVKKLG